MLITNARLVNEGRITEADLLISGGRIRRIAPQLSAPPGHTVLDAAGRLLMPGMIDDQVHFREPGMTHKGDLLTESRAAVAGGITSFMEMPNTRPQTSTREALQAKYDRAAGRASANYAFYLGATNDNLEQIKALQPGEACGVKVFMGASTGNMLVDSEKTLEGIFSSTPYLVATHCEDTPTILANEAQWRRRFGDAIPISAHPKIRSHEACWLSSSLAVSLARRHGTRLHVLHLTTAREMALFEPGPIESKQITAEVCVHHLWFDESDYPALGTRIKCNPAIKSADDRRALLQALREDRIDIIATDHAPHTREEKAAASYFQAPAGLPLVQHALVAVLELVRRGELNLTQAVHKLCHAPAIRYRIAERGFLREGYWADLVLVDDTSGWTARDDNALAKCGWTPFHGQHFSHRVAATWVNGVQVYDGVNVYGSPQGRRLAFDH